MLLVGLTRVLAKNRTQAFGYFPERCIGLNRSNDVRHQVLISASRALNSPKSFTHLSLIAARANAIEPFNLLMLKFRIETKQWNRSRFVRSESIHTDDRLFARLDSALIVISRVLDL